MTRSLADSDPPGPPVAPQAAAPTPGAFAASVEVEGTVAQVTLTGELDIAAAPALSETLADLSARDLKRVVLDLRGLTFIDSSGLRAILRADDEARSNGHEFLLVRGTPAVQRVFEVTRMDQRLNILSAPA